MWAEQIALGELQLQPGAFWRLTPREFRLVLAGFFRREDRDWQRVAVLGGWVLSPYTSANKKHLLTIDGLLGRRLTVYPRTEDD